MLHWAFARLFENQRRDSDKCVSIGSTRAFEGSAGVGLDGYRAGEEIKGYWSVVSFHVNVPMCMSGFDDWIRGLCETCLRGGIDSAPMDYIPLEERLMEDPYIEKISYS